MKHDVMENPHSENPSTVLEVSTSLPNVTLQVLKAILADCETKPEEYLEETRVPYGGE